MCAGGERRNLALENGQEIKCCVKSQMRDVRHGNKRMKPRKESHHYAKYNTLG